MVTGDHPVTA